MGLFDKLRNELVDIIEWVDDSNHTLCWRFPRYHNQIKNGANLIVRPGQKAVFLSKYATYTYEIRQGASNALFRFSPSVDGRKL